MKRANARDNFNSKTIKKLQERARHQCSNPECDVRTSAPGQKPDDVVSIGVACHIHAAALGGPRYRSSMNPEERRSIHNGIWLCNNCSRMVDADIDTYPGHRLLSWKHDAEERRRQELGKRPPRPSDAIDTLTAAFTGQAKNFLPLSIANVHQAAEKHLNTLDPRFTIASSYIDRTQGFVIHAREETTITFHVPDDVAPLWTKGIGDSAKHGVAVELPVDGATITGSPLFEYLAPPSGSTGSKIVVCPRTKEAVVRLALRRGEESQHFADLHGTVTFGTETFTFAGSACGGMFRLKFCMPWSKVSGTQTITLDLNLDRWHMVDVRYLPYFDALHMFYRCASLGWQVEITLEIDGLQGIRGGTRGGVVSDAIDDVRYVLDHIARVQEISTHIDTPIQYANDVAISYEERATVAEVAATMRGERVYTGEQLASDPSCTFVLNTDGETCRKLLVPEHHGVTRIEVPGEEIRVFGQPVQLPPLEIFLTGVLARPNKDFAMLKQGDEVGVVWARTSATRCEYRYTTIQSV